MATPKKSHRFMGSSEALNPPKTEPEDAFEFDESEVWSTNDISNETKDTKPARPSRKHKSTTPTKSVDKEPVGPKSLPVNIPDWSKILRGEYRKQGLDEYEVDDDDSEDFDGSDKMPPHEYLARTRAASLSAHEGVGRTSRDLSRVRNEIWKRIGFED